MASANTVGDGIFSATYNGVSLHRLLPYSIAGIAGLPPHSSTAPLILQALQNPVWEFQFVGPENKKEHVMRRQSDNWVNATHILKAAGFDKPARTRILERDVQKGRHEKVQGGYGKFQGTPRNSRSPQEMGHWTTFRPVSFVAVMHTDSWTQEPTSLFRMPETLLTHTTFSTVCIQSSTLSLAQLPLPPPLDMPANLNSPRRLLVPLPILPQPHRPSSASVCHMPRTTRGLQWPLGTRPQTTKLLPRAATWSRTMPTEWFSTE